jgi:hypothetical protein
MAMAKTSGVAALSLPVLSLIGFDMVSQVLSLMIVNASHGYLVELFDLSFDITVHAYLIRVLV